MLPPANSLPSHLLKDGKGGFLNDGKGGFLNDGIVSTFANHQLNDGKGGLLNDGKGKIANDGVYVPVAAYPAPANTYVSDGAGGVFSDGAGKYLSDGSGMGASNAPSTTPILTPPPTPTPTPTPIPAAPPSLSGLAGLLTKYVNDGAGGVFNDGAGGRVFDGISGLVEYTERDQVFFVAEIDAYNSETKKTDVIRISDIGYRTRATDPGGVIPYPGLLDTAFEIDRKIALDPTQASSRSDGNIRVINLGSKYDAFVNKRNNDSRGIRIYIGQKSYDPSRGIYLDPPIANLSPFFSGITASWKLSEEELTIPVKDTSFWTSRPISKKSYAGTGGLEGDASLAGKPLPIVRGGTREYPVLNVPLTQVDPVRQIWQYTDNRGEIIALFEGGASVFTYAGDVDDLYVGTTPVGAFRTCNAKGLIQLGSEPVGIITANVTGEFAKTGQNYTAVSIAYNLITETLGLPLEYIDTSAFIELNALRPYVAGFFLQDNSTVGTDLVQNALMSVGARLSSTRSGKIKPFLIRPISGSVYISKSVNKNNIIAVEGIQLPTNLDPPPYRFQLLYNRNNTVMSSSLNKAIEADTTRKRALSSNGYIATYANPIVSQDWVRPNDPSPAPTILLKGEDALAMAKELSDVWSVNPRYFNITVPMYVASGLDIGDILDITWPLGVLANGALVQIVGEQIRSFDLTVTFQVLTTSMVVDFSSADFSEDFSGG